MLRDLSSLGAGARLDPAETTIIGDLAYETVKARAYLTSPSKDLETVCSLAGVDMESVIDRIRKQVANAAPVDRMATPKPPTPRKRDAVYAYEGRCLTIRQWSDATGIPVNVIGNRLRKGWPVAQALTVPKGEVRGRSNTITHEGETLTYRQWAERTGLSWFTIRDRVDKGWPAEEVLRPGDLRGAHMKDVAA